MEAEILNRLGEAARHRGEPDRARAHHQEAIITARRNAQPHSEADAHRGLGHAHHDLGELAQARQQWQRALDLYLELGLPDADDVRTLMANLDLAG